MSGSRLSRASSVLSNASHSSFVSSQPIHAASTMTSTAYYQSHGSYYGSNSGSGSRYSSRASTPTSGINPDASRINLRCSRSPTPTYTDMLIQTSRRQRRQSIPPPPPPPEKVIYHAPPLASAATGKPPTGMASSSAARVVASDFYRGKVKSIYEREPLFREFSAKAAAKSADGKGQLNLYNSEQLSSMKSDFKAMVEDKYRRVSFNDPSVGRDAGTKLCPWSNVLHKASVPASQALGEKHSLRKRESSPFRPLPRVTLYHRSTL